MSRLRLVPPDHSPDKVAVLATRFAGDDYALIAGIRRGDGAAATAFFERYRALVERTLVRILGFDSELADTVQETFVRAFGSTHLLRDPQALAGWLIQIAVCAARDLIRKRRRRWWLQLFSGREDVVEQSDVAGQDTELDLEAREALRGAQALLDGLPVDERLAFSLRRFEGMELKEVALACKCSLATIKRRLVRAETRFSAGVGKHPALEKWLAERGGEDT
jgi:RNA polymerase sigma-70 factor, ECF subfamily